MEALEKNNEKMVIKTDMNISLANAIRRSLNEVETLAIEEVDIYKNDTALYDEVVASRLGLVPLKNQKLKKDGSVEMKLKVKAKEDSGVVLSGELGENVVFGEMPIVILEKGQEVEVVARAKVGTGKDHAKHLPGLIYYKHRPDIKISKEGEKQKELAELYPEIFSFEDKLKVIDEWKCDLDHEDMKEYPGVEIELKDDLIFYIESWGQITVKDVFIESCKALKSNISEVVKALK